VADLLYPLLPIWTLYFTGAPGLIGGNFDLGLAMLFASYTDVMPSASERATLFFLTTSMQYVAQAFCPPVGGWLMNLDGNGGTPEVALIVSLATALVAAFVTIFFFPETLDKSRRDKPS
jgi:MFS family permease